jgi:SAM-dependent methyltransferase
LRLFRSSLSLTRRMRLYAELAPWFHLLTHPKDYVEEADFIARVLEAVADGDVRTVLELGSGGGNNASHLKSRFELTLTDVSEDMLELSRSLNPECEHVHDDMRTLRLGREFDAVLAHDAISYMASEDDLRSALDTVAAHLRPGGAAVLLPDTTRELFREGIETGGHDGEDGRSLRYLHWTRDDDPDDDTYQVDFVVLVREPGRETRVVHELHTEGLFGEGAWRRLIGRAGLEAVEHGIPDPHEGEHAVFAARRPA